LTPISAFVDPTRRAPREAESDDGDFEMAYAALTKGRTAVIRGGASGAPR